MSLFSLPTSTAVPGGTPGKGLLGGGTMTIVNPTTSVATPSAQAVAKTTAPASVTSSGRKAASSANPSAPTPTTAADPVSPTKNLTPVPAGSRRPRGFLKMNGVNIALTELGTTSTSHFTPDSWTASVPLYQQPQGIDLTTWDKSDPSATIELHFGFLTPKQSASAFPLTSTVIITGQIDQISPDIGKGVVNLSGRDLTARLVDNKTATRNPNLSSSDVVAQIAAQFGFTPRITKTTTPTGAYYSGGYSQMSGSQPYWDIVTFLAQQENFDAYVSGNTLYFGPIEADTDTSPWTVYLKTDGRGRVWGNVIDMVLTRSPNIAKDISVVVISANSKTGRSVKVTASRAGTYLGTSSRSRAADTTQSIVVRKPGMTAAKAQDVANALLAEYSKFEREYSVTIEGDPTMSQRKMTQIIGTGTSWDTKYYIRNIVRKWTGATGFVMTVAGKNIPTENQAAL